MKGRLAWVGLLLTGIVAWVVLMPASSLNNAVMNATSGRLQLINSSGSVWHGRAQLGLSDGGTVRALPGDVQWHVVVLSSGLWLGLSVNHPTMLQPVHLGWASGGITLQAGKMEIPASWLSSLGAPFNTIKPEGVFKLDWARWQTGESANVTMKWVDAQSALASIRPLGEYVVSLKGMPEKEMNLTIQTLKGPLFVEGQGKLVPNRRMAFSGYAYSDEKSRPALTGLLSQMGRQEGDKYRLGVF